MFLDAAGVGADSGGELHESAQLSLHFPAAGRETEGERRTGQAPETPHICRTCCVSGTNTQISEASLNRGERNWSIRFSKCEGYVDPSSKDNQDLCTLFHLDIYITNKHKQIVLFLVCWFWMRWISSTVKPRTSFTLSSSGRTFPSPASVSSVSHCRDHKPRYLRQENGSEMSLCFVSQESPTP